MATKDYVVNLSDFTAEGKAIDAKKKNAIRIDGLTLEAAKALTYSINEGNLVISDGVKSLKVSNYSGIKYIKTDYVKAGKKVTFKLYDIISESVVDNTTNPITAYNLKKLTAVGTNYNDTIDMSTSGYVPTGKNLKANKGLTVNAGNGNDTVIGTIYNDTIKGGNGNDTITGGKGNDAITGGAGNTVVNYAKGDGNDIITLTKGEKFTLNLTDLNIGDLNYSFANKNKDLVISYDKGGVKGSITLKNFVAKDVTNNANAKKKIADTSSVDLVALDGIVDLRTKIYSSSTGTRFNDNIDRSDYQLYKDKQKTIEQNDVTKKGLTINGGTGNDTIVGTKYSDTIKGGAGDDVIKGGKGNDKLYGEAGNNTFFFNKGDGKDILYSGKGQDTLIFNENVSPADVKFQKSGKKNLVINYNFVDDVAQDSITIKNYYNAKGKVVSSVKYINVGGREYDLETFKGYVDSGRIMISQDATVYGTAEDDIIFAAGDIGQTIRAGQGNDIIYATNTSVNGYFWGDEGNDTIHASDNYASQTLLGGNGDDILYGSNYDGADVLTGQCVLSPGLGNNIVYAGEYSTKYINLNYDGGTTVYTSSGENNAKGQNAINRIFLTNHGQLKTTAHDTLYWQGSNNVKLEMSYWKSDKIFLTKETDSNDLVVRYAADASMTLKDYYKEGNEQMATSIGITPSDYGYISVGSLLEHQGGVMTKMDGFTGTDNADYIEGTDEAETIKGNAGNDVIRPHDGNDTIYLGSGNDYLFAGKGNKTVYADSGNNTIYLGNGVNTLYAGTGEDTIFSGFVSGNKDASVTVEFRADDTGNDIINLGGNNKTLIFKGDTLDDLSMNVANDDYDPVITRSNGRTVTFRGNSTKAVDNTTFTIKDKNGATTNLKNMNTVIGHLNYSYDQVLTTYNGNDTLNTGSATDNINAGSGTNTINLVKVASGNNNSYTYANGTDTFVLPDSITNFDGITMLKKNTDLLVGFNGDISNNTVNIKNYFDNESMKNNIIFKANGSTKTLNTLLTEKGYDEVIDCNGSHNLDYATSPKAVSLAGCAEGDVLTGSAYNDTLNGKGGSDTLIGRQGDDTYIIEEANWGKGKVTINDAAGTNDKLLLGAYINQNVNLDQGTAWAYFEVNQNGTLTDGNVGYTTGTDLYINKDRDYNFDNATTSDGVKIEKYFTTGTIEHIRNIDDTADIFSPMVIPAIGQTVANWLYKNGFTSTSDAAANGTDAQKEALLNLYKPFVSIWSNKTGTPGDDFLIATKSTYQSVYGGNGNDVIYASNYYMGDYIVGGYGDDIIYGSNYNGDKINNGYNDIHTVAGNDTVYAGEYCTKYIYLGDGDDTVYTSSGELNSINKFASNQIWVDYDAKNYNGGHDTIYWRGTQGLSVNFYGYNNKELAFTRNGASDDLVVRYGDDNSVTMKDYYKAGNEALADCDVSTMNNRGGGKFSVLISYQGGEMDYTKTTLSSYSGDDNANYIVAEDGCSSINAGEGCDTVIAKGYSTVYTNNKNVENGKDTTPNIYDQVKLVGGTWHNVYAQSPFNIITSTVEGGSSENYYAYIDQTTYINDNGGNDDWLILQNTKNTTDAAKTNLKVMFDVSSDYTYDGTEASRRLVGNVLITNNATKANFNNFKDRISYGFEGVCVKDNNIDQILSSDSYGLTSDDIATLAQDIAGWLSGNGYADVSAVFKGNNEADINAVIAKFNTANWVDISDL